MRKIIALIFINFISISLLLGQSINLLEKKLKNENLNNTQKIEILNILSRELSYVDTKRSLEYAKKALNLSYKANYEIGIAYAYRNLSNIYTNNEIYFLGMEYIQISLNIFQNKNDSVGIANCYISLGHLYCKLHNIKKEINYNKKSFEIFSRLKMPQRIGVTSHNLGESYFHNGEFENCRRLILYSIKINDSIGQLPVLSSCYKVLGLLEFSQNNFDLAEKHFKNVLKISEQLGENSQKIATVEALINLSKIYKIKKNDDLQILFLKKAIEFCKDNKLASYLPETYIDMIISFSAKNEQNMVQKYIVEYKIVSDSINNKNLKDKTDLVNSLIKVHELEKENNILEQNRILQQESIKKRELLLSLSIIFSFLLIWLLIKLAKRNKKIQTINRIIADQKAQLELLIATKDKLLSVIAHDLRSPFNIILGMSELLLKNIYKYEIEKTIQLIEYVNDSAKSTLDLLEKLLAWVKNQTGQISFNPEYLNLKQIFEEVMTTLELSAKLKKIR